MKYLSLYQILLLFMMVFINFSQGQIIPSKASTKASIKDIRILNTDEGIVIIYKLEGTGEYLVQFEIWSKTRNKLEAKSFSGDFGNVTAGGLKKAIWNYKKDEIFVNEDIKVRITALPMPEINVSKHLAKSILFPGLGDYHLKKDKEWWLLGAAGYGLAASSIILNRISVNTYNNYQNTTDPELVDSYFDKSVMQRKISFGLAAVAAGIWAYDLIGIMRQSNQIKKGNKTSDEIWYIQNEKPMEEIALSDYRSINTSIATIPPVLKLLGKPVFTDGNSDKVLDANEKAVIVFVLQNEGKGKAIRVEPEVNIIKGKGFSIETSKPVDIEPGEKTDFMVTILAGPNTVDDTVKLEIKGKEMMGNSSKSFTHSFASRHLLLPELKVQDYQFLSQSSQIIKGEIINLKVVIENTGEGIATDIGGDFVLPSVQGFNLISKSSNIHIPKLSPGDTVVRELKFNLNENYPFDNVEISLQLEEKQGVKLDKLLKVYLHRENREEFSEEGISDIEQDIPVTRIKRPNTFALIIANENYTIQSSNPNVDFAINDGKAFKTYAIKVLGIPEKNILFTTNATAGKMRESLNDIKQIMKTDSTRDFYIYYAGHGCPDHITQEAYIIPVDINYKNLSSAISLKEFYSYLNSYPSKMVTIFLDACFSGSLISARSVRIKPKENDLKRNLVVFSSSSNDELSVPYREKKHGLFTYFLLEKLKSTKGEVSYGVLYDYVFKAVRDRSLMEKSIQSPGIRVNPDLNDKWKDLRFNSQN